VDYPILPLEPSDYAKANLGLLNEIPEPPKSLWYRGVLPETELKLLAVVGSRQYTDYGKQAVDSLISGLKNYPIGIVSGLALGMDALAHESALRNGLYTMAVPGSGIDDSVIAPRTNLSLAKRILDKGGALLSEFAPTFEPTKWAFPQRNRIMAGLCPATLLIEAGEKSGTLITARLAVDYNRELLVVPGSIFSKNSYGTHQFLKLGAIPVTESKDIIEALGLTIEEEVKAQRPDLTEAEAKVIEILHNPTDRDSLVRQLNLPVAEVSILLMNMEMQGYIKYSPPNYLTLI